MASRPLVRCYITTDLLRLAIGLPDEVEIVGATWDPDRAVFAILLRGDRFPSVPEGDMVPMVCPVVRREDGEPERVEWPYYGVTDSYGVKA